MIPTASSAGTNHSFCSQGDSVAFSVEVEGSVVAVPAAPVSVNVSSGSPPPVTSVVEVGLLVLADVASNGVDTAPYAEPAAGGSSVQVKPGGRVRRRGVPAVDDVVRRVADRLPVERDLDSSSRSPRRSAT